jgi:phosphatidylethanolamine-binding protein (PEBP) family uncharacterized protein
VLVLALALAGCGSSGSGATSASSAFGNIQFTLPGVDTSPTSTPAMPVRYTCDGKDISPAMEWGTVPVGTKELAIFLISISTAVSKGFTPVWAMAGVNPELHKLAAGEMPRGAFLGYNGKRLGRYSLCPPKGENATYQFGIYSLRPSVRPTHHFEDNELLKVIASGPSPTSATAGGGLRVTYTRK